jgi:hypothetical protein
MSPGIGFLLTFWLGYGFAYAAYNQGFGSGGSLLYWLTGNPSLGQPTAPGTNVKDQGSGRSLPNPVTQTRGGQVINTGIGTLGH